MSGVGCGFCLWLFLDFSVYLFYLVANSRREVWYWHGSRIVPVFFFQASSQDTSKLANEIDEKLEELSNLENSNEVKLDQLDKEPLEQGFTDEETEKRNIGRWKNYRWNLQKYKQDREKRFIGRWKNINWLNYRHGLPDSQTAYNDLDKRPYSYVDDIGYDDQLVPYLYGDDILEKRQGGRWALINRQLNKLAPGNSRSKKDDGFEEFTDDESDVDKRMGSRWMLIQNKLRDLAGRSKRSLYDKRFIGRWKIYNWMRSHGNVNSDSALPWNDKRNIGRWKNQNWLLQHYRDRKSKLLN